MKMDASKNQFLQQMMAHLSNIDEFTKKIGDEIEVENKKKLKNKRVVNDCDRKIL